MALKFNVRLVMYGENQAEYGNIIEENLSPQMSQDFFSIDDQKKSCCQVWKFKRL